MRILAISPSTSPSKKRKLSGIEEKQTSFSGINNKKIKIRQKNLPKSLSKVMRRAGQVLKI
jgi:hypothetical protein